MNTVTSIGGTSTVQRNVQILCSKVGEETLMLDVEQGDYYVLSPVTARIWELLETPTRVTDLTATLEREYEVEPDVCRTEVINVLRGLADQGLVQATVP